ncbi:MAG: sensor histidine kinase, partial [Burkholderiales bacterium]
DALAAHPARPPAEAKISIQRQTLVREVHHRIKNNLQAVVGLLRRQLGVHPELAGSLETAISQVNTVAVVHGLQGRDGTDDMRLIDLLAGIAVAAENEVERALVLPPLAGLAGIVIDGEESVPIAMVLNELLINALKHARLDPNLPPVQVHVDRREPAIILRIENSFEDDGGPLAFVRSKHGGGLKLVQALLPARGATLSWLRKEPGILVAELVLNPPVLRLAANKSSSREIS